MTIRQAILRLQREGYKIKKGPRMAEIQFWQGNEPNGAFLMWSTGIVIKKAEELKDRKVS